MAKTKLEIDGMSCQHCVKTVTDALTTLQGVQRVKVNLRKGEAVVRYDASYITDANLAAAITAVGFEAVTKTEPLALRLIGGILITLLSITGCSDMPYTGSMLTAEDVDRYITIVEDSACLLSGHESVCITLIPETRDESRPIIHIHPNKVIYVFYREGVQIIQAEIVMDTTEIMEEVKSLEEDSQPPGTDGRDDGSSIDTNGDDTNGGGTQQPDILPPISPLIATAVEAVSGDGQIGEVNQHLPNPLVVRVLDQHNNPLPGIAVSFTVSPSNGVLSPTSATTGSNGEASTILRLGTTAGTYTVTASVSGIAQQVIFTAIATRPSPGGTQKPGGDTQQPGGRDDGNNNGGGNNGGTNGNGGNGGNNGGTNGNGGNNRGTNGNGENGETNGNGGNNGGTNGNGENGETNGNGGNGGNNGGTNGNGENGETNGNGGNNGENGGNPQPPQSPPSNVRVAGESEILPVSSGLIDLRIHTGSHNDLENGCGARGQQLQATAYKNMDMTILREHQHWSACKNNNLITIYLYRHPGLTCNIGPNIHYLKITGTRPTEIKIKITEYTPGINQDCP